MSDHSIKIYRDLNDPVLIKAWDKLYQEGETFVQSSYAWVSSWIEHNNNNKPCIVAAERNGKIVGIAPFIEISKLQMVKGLQSAPVHFGDFFSYVTTSSNRQEIIGAINTFIVTNNKWKYIKIDNVNEKDYLYKSLICKKFSRKLFTKISILNFKNKSYQEYLQTLSKNRRNKTRQYLNNLNKKHQVDFVAVTDYHQYISYFNEMRSVYTDRNEVDVNEKAYSARNSALSSLFEKKQAVLFLLIVDNKIASYHLGFLFNNYFYSWKEAFISEFNKFSPGVILRILLIPEYLIGKKMSGINYMAGDYSYKKSQIGDDGLTLQNDQFLLGRGVVGGLVVKYYLQYRDVLKAIKGKILKQGR